MNDILVSQPHSNMMGDRALYRQTLSDLCGGESVCSLIFCTGRVSVRLRGTGPGSQAVSPALPITSPWELNRETKVLV